MQSLKLVLDSCDIYVYTYGIPYVYHSDRPHATFPSSPSVPFTSICSPPLPPLPLTLHSEGDVCIGSPNNIGGGAGVNTTLIPLYVVEQQHCVATDDVVLVRPLEHVRCGTGR